VLVPVRLIYLPSPECRALWFLGEALGIAGIVLCWWQHRRFSWSSALGVAIAVLSAMIGIACEMLMYIM